MMDHSEAETPNIAYKKFTFEDNNENTQESLSVSIPEVLDPHYGMYVWPCAVVLAQYLWSQRQELRDKTVLEVILSDNAEKPLCLENCRRSCAANGLHDISVLPLTWGEVSPELTQLPQLDIILGSDVFYEPRDFEDVLLTIAYLLRKNPRAQFWTTYQERSADWSIEVLLNRWKMSCVDVDLETFDADKSELAGSSLPGNHSIDMIIITLETGDLGL
ncbi:hypothetical protein F7725_002945 [Dissostichus mawsoni]|uniref:Methyltransferase-like protein 23 n=1 Tax=Dissostichus mawsoni TaxID=36200 RepID=A0A7J5YBC7_DISMA|nr:hypothetical protein F7725_002945 [Dissostichus mawsoni]